jgi:hypothetical protein
MNNRGSESGGLDWVCQKKIIDVKDSRTKGRRKEE